MEHASPAEELATGKPKVAIASGSGNFSIVVMALPLQRHEGHSEVCLTDLECDPMREMTYWGLLQRKLQRMYHCQKQSEMSRKPTGVEYSRGTQNVGLSGSWSADLIRARRRLAGTGDPVGPCT